MTKERREDNQPPAQEPEGKLSPIWQSEELLPPVEVLLAVREDKVPILNLKNPRRVCPLACGYCDTLETVRRQGDLKPSPRPERTLGIIDLLKRDYGLRAIEFCGDGEPLADWSLITKILEEELRLSLFTNGVYLSEARAALLTRHEALVKVKLDAIDPLLFGEILLAGRNRVSRKQAVRTGEAVITGMNNMIAARERLGGPIGRLIASIVVTNVNFPLETPVEKSPLAEVLKYCEANRVIPQVNYVEEYGGNTDGRYSIDLERVRGVNGYLRELFGVEPRILGGENCLAMFAPILTTDGLMAAGPFGMGCEFPLREHLGRLAKTWRLSRPEDLSQALIELGQWRRCEENKRSVVHELTRIEKREGIYNLTGSDNLLPGCGAASEENYLLVYASGLFGDGHYLEANIFPRLDRILVDKWPPEEVAKLISVIR